MSQRENVEHSRVMLRNVARRFILRMEKTVQGQLNCPGPPTDQCAQDVLDHITSLPNVPADITNNLYDNAGRIRDECRAADLIAERFLEALEPLLPSRPQPIKADELKDSKG